MKALVKALAKALGALVLSSASIAHAAPPPDTVGEESSVLIAIVGNMSPTMQEHIVSVTDKTLCVGEARFSGETFVGLWFSFDWWAPCSEKFIPPSEVTLLRSRENRIGYAYHFIVDVDNRPIGEFVKTSRIYLSDLCTEAYANACDLVLTGPRPVIRIR